MPVWNRVSFARAFTHRWPPMTSKIGARGSSWLQLFLEDDGGVCKRVVIPSWFSLTRRQVWCVSSCATIEWKVYCSVTLTRRARQEKGDGSRASKP